MHRLTKGSRRQNKEKSDEFCLLFYRWAKQTTHLNAVFYLFATFPTSNDCEYDSFMLFLLRLSMKHHGTSDLYKYLSFTCTVYAQDWSNVTAVGGDIFIVNRRLVCRLDCDFLVQKSWINLAVLNIS